MDLTYLGGSGGRGGRVESLPIYNLIWMRGRNISPFQALNNKVRLLIFDKAEFTYLKQVCQKWCKCTIINRIYFTKHPQFCMVMDALFRITTYMTEYTF